mgnify:CR=1 FL=1
MILGRHGHDPWQDAGYLHRSKLQMIRLEVEDGIDKRLLKILKNELMISEEGIYRIDGPLDLILGRTLGTCTVANSRSPSPFFLLTSAPIFNDLSSAPILSVL